ncbi:MAG: hypothetical protein FWE96_08195 [Coriobacteriia bacterium]|nr:hypothetical protein [Coriobacteriia bacterium]
MQLIAWVLAALALTILIECGLSLLFRQRELTYCVLLCNLLTNPLLNLTLLLLAFFFGLQFYYVVMVILELVIVIVEAFIIALLTNTRPRKALLLSLLFNSASFGTGLLLHTMSWA